MGAACSGFFTPRVLTVVLPAPYFLQTTPILTMPETLPRYAFGPFLLNPAERHLLRDGRPVALPPKALDVLAILTARAGHLVAKDDLLEAAWPGVVVEENALSVAVSRLRTALGEAGRGYVETVPGHGYRFVAPVTVLSAAETDEPYPLAGDSMASGPSVEDVVPTLSGDGVGRLAPTQKPPARTVPLDDGPARGNRSAWRIELFSGVGLIVLLVLVVLASRGNRADETPTVATHDPPAEALLAYRRGHALWESRRGETMIEALAQFNRATALDSAFAAAYVGEAQVYALGYRTGPAAEAAIARALTLDSTLAEAWATRGFVRAFQYWDWAGAEAAIARAAALDPDDVTTLQWLASLRMVQRKLPEAEAALRRALTRAPDYAALHADLCEVLYYRRAYEEAGAACDRALALDPAQPMALQHRYWIRLAMPEGRVEAAHLLAGGGRADFDAFRRARLHARTGARDSTLAYVEQAVAERMFVAPFLNPDPLFDFVRGDPRWVAAMRRMGLE